MRLGRQRVRAGRVRSSWLTGRRSELVADAENSQNLENCFRVTHLL